MLLVRGGYNAYVTHRNVIREVDLATATGVPFLTTKVPKALAAADRLCSIVASCGIV